MLLKYFYDESLAQASYLIGCAETGEALVVDPSRDVTAYLEMAAREGLRITHVTETHIHADFVSGSRELAARTGATLYISDMGGPDWYYAFREEPGVVRLRDGDRFQVGNILIQALYTPGHTPEHLAFMVTDMKVADRPIGIFTGDFVFAGDVGRPDLLEEAAGYAGTKVTGARQQYASVQKIKTLPDYLQLWPGHGAGSACGKALGAIPSTTLGYEKLFNPAFQFTDEDAFVDWLLAGQPEPPRYFVQMKRINREGPSLLNSLTEPVYLDRPTLDRVISSGALVIDTRPREDFTKAHIHGTVAIPATSRNFSTYVGWFVDYREPLYLIMNHSAQLPGLLEMLRAIGSDQIQGYATEDALHQHTEALPTITAAQLRTRRETEPITIVDVRGRSEYEERHIVGATHILLGHLPDRLAELPRDQMIVTHCASGYRSLIAASYLRRQGFTQVYNLTDSTAVWASVLQTECGNQPQTVAL